MIERKFQKGDVVELKSGGPSMTVRGYEPENGDEIICEWISKDGIHQERAFDENMLKIFFDYKSVEYPIG